MKSIRSFILIITLLLFSNICLAQGLGDFFPQGSDKTGAKKGPVVVNGDKVEYLQNEKKIIGTGNVSITYEDVLLTCDKITVLTETKIGKCEGNVKITQPGAEFSGDFVEYSFAEKTGKILKGHLKADPLYAYAQDLEKVSDKKVVMNEGYVTTCNLEKPHYRIQAKQVRIYLDDKIIAKHVFFYIKNVPVFYVPYYIQPLKDTKTKITVVPGYTNDWGYFLLGSYRYYLSEQCKGYLRLDYRNKLGLGEGIDYNYDAGELGKGTARYYYTNENGALDMDESGDERDRYRFQYKHNINFTDDTQGNIEINKMSDADIVKDYFYNELEDGWSPENYISVISRKENYSFELLAEKRLDDFFSVVERLPEVRLETYNQRLWGSPLYYYNNFSATYFNKTYKESDNRETDTAFRFDTEHKFSYAAKLANFLYTTPYVSTEQTFYSRNRWGDKHELRSIYTYGVDFSTKFYRIFDVKNENLNINGLRHVFSPTIGFIHRNQPTISPSNLYEFDGIDTIDYRNAIDISVENKLQTKRKNGAVWENVDLARLLITTSYGYRFEKGNTSFKGVGKFSDVYLNFELNPTPQLTAKTTMTFDFTDGLFADSAKKTNTDVYYKPNEKFWIGLGHIYENSADGDTSQVTLETEYKLNEDWAFRAYERFDTYEQKWEEQEYTVFKDLHCWLAEFSLNIRDDNEYAFWVIFRIKAFPDTPIGFKRTYRRSGTL